MTETAAETETAESPIGMWLRQVIEDTRVLIVGGIPVGVLVVGVFSHLAMLLLRVTSPDYVRGVTSDDGFTIGQVTLAGSYNLMLLGAAVGVIGAGAYRLVAPRLIGPTWFRRLTTGLASAAVVGSMLVHADGVDFTLLKPTWLAIALFVALPGMFGALIGVSVDSVSRPESWTVRGRWRWLLPIIAVGCFPLSAFVIIFAAIVIGIGVMAREVALIQRIRGVALYSLAVRSAWLLAAVAGLVALVNDIGALT